MLIDHDFHFFSLWKSHGKSFLKKSGHPVSGMSGKAHTVDQKSGNVTTTAYC